MTRRRARTRRPREPRTRTTTPRWRSRSPASRAPGASPGSWPAPAPARSARPAASAHCPRRPARSPDRGRGRHGCSAPRRDPRCRGPPQGWDGDGPPPMISTALTPAAAAAVAALAARACECRMTACQPGTPGGWPGFGKPAGPNWPARAVTAARCASPASVPWAHILSTCSRKPGTSATRGSTPANRAGVSSRRLRSPQVSHWSMCRLTRLRSSGVICPSHPASRPSSAVQSPRPARATSSAPRDRSSWLRARDCSAWAWLRETPSASASSSLSSPCTRLSWMTSCSPGFSPLIASLTS